MNKDIRAFYLWMVLNKEDRIKLIKGQHTDSPDYKNGMFACWSNKLKYGCAIKTKCGPRNKSFLIFNKISYKK